MVSGNNSLQRSDDIWIEVMSLSFGLFSGVLLVLLLLILTQNQSIDPIQVIIGFVIGTYAILMVFLGVFIYSRHSKKRSATFYVMNAEHKKNVSQQQKDEFFE